jgi:nucleoid DNA-binding protein
LIEELIFELKNGNKIIIPNFGILEIKNLKPKKIKSIKTGKLKFAKKTKALRFSLARKLSKFLIKNL